jgi:hypothetical protein
MISKCTSHGELGRTSLHIMLFSSIIPSRGGLVHQHKENTLRLIFLWWKVPGQTGARTRNRWQHHLALNTWFSGQWHSGTISKDTSPGPLSRNESAPVLSPKRGSYLLRKQLPQSCLNPASIKGSLPQSCLIGVLPQSCPNHAPIRPLQTLCGHHLLDRRHDLGTI